MAQNCSVQSRGQSIFGFGNQSTFGFVVGLVGFGQLPRLNLAIDLLIHLPWFISVKLSGIVSLTKYGHVVAFGSYGSDS